MNIAKKPLLIAGTAAAAVALTAGIIAVAGSSEPADAAAPQETSASVPAPTESAASADPDAPGPPADPAVAADAAPAEGPLSTKTHLFYYPWYGTPSGSGSYIHWPQGGRTPPEDIGANLYPALGAYDSSDVAGVMDKHMEWVKRSGAGTIVTSWWGQGSRDDKLAASLLEAAARHGIKVAWHLEPYDGRSAQSTVDDVNYINTKYGASPAFYRDAEHGNRGAFYVFESLRIGDWTALESVKAHSIVLAQTTNTAAAAHFGGLYTYDGMAAQNTPGWAEIGNWAKANGMVWAPSVAPGYIDDRAVPDKITPSLGRDKGNTYDKAWANALASSPSWVSVTSFNEWHEGSPIEPAAPNPPAGHAYETYDGAYGRTGDDAQFAYLDRTKYWASQF